MAVSWFEILKAAALAISGVAALAAFLFGQEEIRDDELIYRS